MSKLGAVLDGINPNQVPEDPLVATIFDAQQQIHWEQLMLGQFATEWGIHQRTHPGTKKHSPSNWTTEVINFIYAQWWTLWELWNHNRHRRDMATSQQAAAQQVDRELTMFYEEYKSTQLLRWVFNTPIKLQ